MTSITTELKYFEESGCSHFISVSQDQTGGSYTHTALLNGSGTGGVYDIDEPATAEPDSLTRPRAMLFHFLNYELLTRLARRNDGYAGEAAGLGNIMLPSGYVYTDNGNRILGGVIVNPLVWRAPGYMGENTFLLTGQLHMSPANKLHKLMMYLAVGIIIRITPGNQLLSFHLMNLRRQAYSEIFLTITMQGSDQRHIHVNPRIFDYPGELELFEEREQAHSAIALPEESAGQVMPGRLEGEGVPSPGAIFTTLSGDFSQ